MTTGTGRMTRQSELRSFVFDHWPYKLITLCFAVLTWAYVQSEQIVEDRVRVKLEWTLPDGLVALETPLESATVTVAGVQALMRNVRPVDLVMSIDLSGAKEGDATVELADRPIRGLPAELRVVAVTPGTLRVQLDRNLRRRVKVSPRTRGDPSEGFIVKGVSVTPDRVELTGPASVLRAMTEIATEDVDVSGLREDAEFEVALGMVKSSPVRMVKPGPFTVSVQLGSTVLRAGHLVLALGVGSPRLLPWLPVIPRAGQLIVTDGPADGGVLLPGSVTAASYLLSKSVGSARPRR